MSLLDMASDASCETIIGHCYRQLIITSGPIPSVTRINNWR